MIWHRVKWALQWWKPQLHPLLMANTDLMLWGRVPGYTADSTHVIKLPIQMCKSQKWMTRMTSKMGHSFSYMTRDHVMNQTVSHQAHYCTVVHLKCVLESRCVCIRRGKKNRALNKHISCLSAMLSVQITPWRHQRAMLCGPDALEHHSKGGEDEPWGQGSGCYGAYGATRWRGWFMDIPLMQP